MLDAREDGNDERFASSRKYGSSKTTKADVGNRTVYKLVKVGDDGSILAATEDDIFRSLVGELDNGLFFYDPESGDVVGDDDDKDGSEYVASDEDDSNGRANIIPVQNLAIERQRLKAQIEVLDCILMRVDLEEKKPLSTKIEVARKVEHCRKGNPSTYVNASDGSRDYKRQRRPNPKYFDYDAGDDSLMRPPLSSTYKESMPKPLSSQKPLRNTVVVSPRLMSSWGSHLSLAHAAISHKATTAVLQKPLIQAQKKVTSTCHILNIVSKEDNTISLDNLSIRELHEAFCSTHGRETSVKDKHWLKRQILTGWMRQHDVVIRSNSHQQVQNKFEAQLDCVTHKEQPLSTTIPLNVGVIEKDIANKIHFQKANDVEHFQDSFRNKLGSRCFQGRMSTLTALSRGGSFRIVAVESLNGSSASNGQTTIYGDVINNGEVVEGKRQRKPNRRYIEDEAHVAFEFVPVHDNRSFYGQRKDVGLNSTANYSWKSAETDGSLNTIERYGNIKRSNVQNVSSKKFLPIQRPKLISSGMKQKVGGRATKLVTMTHTTAQAKRHNAEVVVCKAKLQLLATPYILKNGIPNVNGEARDQASTVLPIVQFDPSGVVQPLILDSRVESEELIVTIPTAKGGMRRKHHRPWTLREVMTLVEGVARCGGGKWADIKKLAFSTIGYRTAVDLKDKWRNLLRASRTQQHPAKQGERKKQFTAAIPASILARVHELASLPNQIPSSTLFVSNTSRIGQIIHRK